MRILLVCSTADGGHYSENKAFLTKAFSEIGHEVLPFHQSIQKTKKISKYIPGYARTRLQIRLDALLALRILAEFIQHLRNNSQCPDFLYFAFLDEWMGQYLTRWDFDSQLGIPFSGTLFSPPTVHQMAKTILRQGPFDRYNVLKSKWCRSVCLMFEEAIPVLMGLIKKPVYEIPDVVAVPPTKQDNSFGEHIRNIAGHRFIIGLWGALEIRKGTSEFLQMPLGLPSEEFFFVMGGRIHGQDKWPENEKLLLPQSKSGIIENLIILDQWLSDDELWSGMRACDLIFAAYPGFRFTSGIIGKAAALRIPILVNDGFVMARRVRDFNLGFVKQEKADVTRWVSGNIGRIKELRGSLPFQEGCLKYCERYGYGQWKRALTHLIEP